MCGAVWEDVKWEKYVLRSLWRGSCAPSYTNTQLKLHDSKYSSILSTVNIDINFHITLLYYVIIRYEDIITIIPVNTVSSISSCEAVYKEEMCGSGTPIYIKGT